MLCVCVYLANAKSFNSTKVNYNDLVVNMRVDLNVYEKSLNSTKVKYQNVLFNKYRADDVILYVYMCLCICLLSDKGCRGAKTVRRFA